MRNQTIKSAIGSWLMTLLLISSSHAAIVINIAGTDGINNRTGDGGPATAATMDSPNDVVFDSNGSLYIADKKNHLIRKVDSNGIITTIAGNGTGMGGFNGDNSDATQAILNNPSALALDEANGWLYFSDSSNHLIRKLTLNSAPPYAIITVAGNRLADYSGDNGAALNASLNAPQGITLDEFGNLYIADTNNHVIRKLELSSGFINTIAGSGNTPINPAPKDGGELGDGGLATEASLNAPRAVAIRNNHLYIADTGYSRIRQIKDLNLGIITTLTADSGLWFASSNHNPNANNAYPSVNSTTVRKPSGFAFATNGDLFFTDSDSSVIRRISFSYDVVSTIADATQLKGPQGLVADSHNNSYVADSLSHRILKVNYELATDPSSVTRYVSIPPVVITPIDQTQNYSSGTGGALNSSWLLLLGLATLLRRKISQ